MHNSTGTSQTTQDERASGVEGSPLLTIEYLRARLLSERSVSKAAKERVDELAKRVKELEEQLKTVSIQRKRAEKATLDVLSYLQSRGVSDVSEVYESECDEEDSLCESSVLKRREDGNSGPKDSERTGKESSDSEQESAPSSAGSLSWKGRKKISWLLEKRNVDSPTHRRTSFPLVNPSPRHRLGKSCRQVKRRERLAAEELRHDSVKSDIQDSNSLDSADHHGNFSDTRGETLRWIDKGIRKDEASLSLQDEVQDADAFSSNHENVCNGEMKRALKYQAQLIGLYEDQEKAQRDWEEKYGENQVSTADSCQPGNHSDITEERDEASVTISHPGDAACYDNDQKAGLEADSQSKSSISHFNSFKLSPRADTGLSGDKKSNEMQSSRSPAPDFAFPTISSSQTQENEESKSLREVHFAALNSENTLSESYNANREGHQTLMPHEGLQWPGGVLSALQGAKAMLKQQIIRLPESGGFAEGATRTSFSAINDAEWLKFPAACPGLFRVPTDFPSQAPSHSRSLLSNDAGESTGSYLHARAPYLQGYQDMSTPIDSRLGILSADAFSRISVSASSGPARPRVDSRSNADIALSSKSTILPYSSSLPRMSSDHMSFGF